MAKFDPNSSRCVVIMYPTGGYGNFFYYLLSEHLESTVKISTAYLEFNENGNSHRYPKYTEIFSLGSHYSQKTLRDFKYGYEIFDSDAEKQINSGKHFVVLADVGNKGDNVRFLRRFFPQADIIRVFAETFEEKLILWANAMTKSQPHDLYPESVMPKQGIAIWANKSVDDLTDQDAVNCLTDFFYNDFDIYGKLFCKPTPGVINFPLKHFFNKHQLTNGLLELAQQLTGTGLINTEQLSQTLDEFYTYQKPLSLLDKSNSSFSLVRRSLNDYKN